MEFNFLWQNKRGFFYWLLKEPVGKMKRFLKRNFFLIYWNLFHIDGKLGKYKLKLSEKNDNQKWSAKNIDVRIDFWMSYHFIYFYLLLCQVNLFFILPHFFTIPQHFTTFFHHPPIYGVYDALVSFLLVYYSYVIDVLKINRIIWLSMTLLGIPNFFCVFSLVQSYLKIRQLLKVL